MAKRRAADPFKGKTPDDFKAWLKKKEVTRDTIAALGKEGFDTFGKFATIKRPGINRLDVNTAQQCLLDSLAKEAQKMKEGKMRCPRRELKTKGKKQGPQGKEGSQAPFTSGRKEDGAKVEETKVKVEEVTDNEASGDSPAGERKRRSPLDEELTKYDGEKRRKQSKGTKEEACPEAHKNFGRNQDEAVDVRPLMQVIPKVPVSVGMIVQRENHVGTGFRVGPKYIMTCWHVVRKGVTGSEMLENLHIKFCHTSADYTGQGSHKLTQLRYKDLELDVAIIEIDGADRLASSPPLQLCRIPQEGPLYFLGHPGFGKDTSQKMDFKIEVVRHEDFTPEFKNQVDEYYEELLQKCNSIRDVHKVYNNPGIDFQRPTEVRWDGMLDENYHIIHTAFLPGASGSPGVQVDAAGRVRVRLMLCRGFPAFYHELTDAGRALHPMPDQKYRFEHGLDLTRLYAKMNLSVDDTVGDLIRQIFC